MLGSRSTPEEIAVAIQQLKDEFNTEQLQINDVIAQGGFGTVYTGAVTTVTGILTDTSQVTVSRRDKRVYRKRQDHSPYIGE